MIHYKDDINSTAQFDQMKILTQQMRNNNMNEQNVSLGLINAFNNIKTTDAAFTVNNLQNYIDCNIRAILWIDTRVLLTELKQDEHDKKLKVMKSGVEIVNSNCTDLADLGNMNMREDISNKLDQFVKCLRDNDLEVPETLTDMDSVKLNFDI